MIVELADPGATAETRSLFAYLDGIRGEGILFGQQHVTSYGLSIGTPDGTTSDAKNVTGAHPALFGWDTLSIYGHEFPGVADAPVAENIAALADYMIKAYEQGGVITLSTHPYNFVTGNDFYDATAGVVAEILPGGSKNAEFNTYLDDIATLAASVKTADGTAIPIIFRPFHENNGSWFWWGGEQCTPGEYIELYRYTVEYLRDNKGVHNFLYAYSPNGSFGGSPDVYLRTYPGDDYVDILGYDHYDPTDASQDWLDRTVADLGMIADMADASGKVSAFTEFGMSGALKGTGNNPAWFTAVLEAIKADPRASRSAYMQTWANFGPEQYFVPFVATDELAEHHLAPDFRAFAEDPFSLFAGEVVGAWDKTGIETTPHDPAARIVTPAGSTRVLTPTTTVRVKVTDTDATSVTVTSDVTGEPITLTLQPSGYYEGEWAVGEENLTNRQATLSLTVETADGPLTSTQTLLLGAKPILPAGYVDDFEGYFDDTSLRDEYAIYQNNTISLEKGTVGAGQNALRFDYDLSLQEYTGIGHQIEGDWSAYTGISFWYQPDGNDQKLVIQVQANGSYWEAYPSMAGTSAQEIVIPFADFVVAPWNNGNQPDTISAADLAVMQAFSVYINRTDDVDARVGSFLIDEIRAVK